MSGDRGGAAGGWWDFKSFLRLLQLVIAQDLPISTLGERMREMIEAQPACLRAIARLDVGREAGLLAGARRIFVVGTGTSFHASELGAYLLRSGGIEAHAVGAMEMARWRPERSSGDGAIVISHTGETAYAQAVREVMRRSGGPLVTITGEGSGWNEAIVTPIREQAETYTVSYTGALAVLGLLAAELVGSETGPASVLGVAEEVERILGSERHGSVQREQISALTAPERALALVGPGPWATTAREGALKVREAAQILADGFDPEALLHGAAVPYGPGDGLSPWGRLMTRTV